MQIVLILFYRVFRFKVVLVLRGIHKLDIPLLHAYNSFQFLSKKCNFKTWPSFDPEIGEKTHCINKSIISYFLEIYLRKFKHKTI